MITKRNRWAILGTHWISGMMTDAIHESKNAELVAVGSRDLNKAKTFAEKYSIPKYYSDYSELLRDQDVDTVYIGLPNHLHKEWIIRCAKAGKHILCEKPFVLNIEEAQEALSVVKENNVFCMEALMYRCHPLIEELQNLLDDKIIGDIKLINATYTANIAHLANPKDGGAIRNLGCYPLSLIRLLAKEEPRLITAQGQLNENSGNASVALATLNFKNGIMATVSTADNIEMWWQFDILGTAGFLSIKNNIWFPEKNNEIILHHDNQEKILKFSAEQSLYTYQIDCVNEHINRGCFSPSEKAVSWEHSLGNIAVMNEWIKQVNNASIEKNS